jgi:hypothetical protein
VTCGFQVITPARRSSRIASASKTKNNHPGTLLLLHVNFSVCLHNEGMDRVTSAYRQWAVEVKV